MAAQELLKAALAAWSPVDLSATRHAALDKQGLEIADNQEQSAAGREVLKQKLQEFKKVPPEERPAKIGGVIKAFQAEVDMLTRRQTFAEGAFLGLYRSLADAPSPLPALRGAEAELKQLSAAAAEAAKLKRELAENDREFEGLKSQEQSIKRLEKELREAEARADAAVEDAVRARDEEATAEGEELAAAAREREAALEAALERAAAEGRAAALAGDAAQEQLFEARAALEQAHASTAAELEALREEAERARSAAVALEGENRTLRGRLEASAAAAPPPSAAETPARARALEELLLAKEAQLTRVTAECAAGERRAEAAEAARAASAASAARAAEALGAAEADLAAARSELASRPSAADHAELRAKLAARSKGLDDEIVVAPAAAAAFDLAHAAEALAAAGAADATGPSATQLPSLLVAQHQQVAARLAVATSELAQREAELGAARASEAALSARLEQQASDIARLEDEQLARRGASPPKTPGAPTAEEAPPSSASQTLSLVLGTPTTATGTGGAAADTHAAGDAEGGGGDTDGATMRAALAAQRDRARREVEELRDDAKRLQGALAAQQGEARRLHGDNLRLYEKVRFLEKGAAAAGGGGGGGNRRSHDVEAGLASNSIADEAMEMRYRKEYEEGLNPFAQFQRKERLQRYAALGPAEKLVMSFSSFFLANRRARLFLFGYILCLHLLTSVSIMEHARHHTPVHLGGEGCS